MPHQRLTSASDPIRVDFLPLPPLGGRVGLTFAPGKRTRAEWDRNLGEDLDRLVNIFHVAHLVSLMEHEELKKYHIPNLFTEAERRGIAVHRFPIADVQVPKQLKGVLPLVRNINSWAQSVTVAIHCRGAGDAQARSQAASWSSRA